MELKSKFWRWVLGLSYIVTVAVIWIAASFVVQSVVDAGVSPFLITYICNSLFVVYIPIGEVGRYVEDKYGSLLFWRKRKAGGGGSVGPQHESGESENTILLGEGYLVSNCDGLDQQCKLVKEGEISQQEEDEGAGVESNPDELGRTLFDQVVHQRDGNKQVNKKGRWTRLRVAKASLVVCPFWFLAQLTFNLSLKYTTVTSNTILSSASSLFTFLVALIFLGEKFTWVKLISVALCMGGTIIVSLGDSESTLKAIATDPLLGDILALVSSALYAVYITLIRVKLPDEEKQGQASMAEFLGYLGLFNIFIFLPVTLVLDFTKLEPFDNLTWQQCGLIVGKGLLDNVLSDYLWAKAVLLTTTIVATAGLTIQVPLAAVIDTVTGNSPHLLDYLGAIAVMIGFAGINIPSGAFSKSKELGTVILENEPVEEKDASVHSQSSVAVRDMKMTNCKI